MLSIGAETGFLQNGFFGVQKNRKTHFLHKPMANCVRIAPKCAANVQIQDCDIFGRQFAAETHFQRHFVEKTVPFKKTGFQKNRVKNRFSPGRFLWKKTVFYTEFYETGFCFCTRQSFDKNVSGCAPRWQIVWLKCRNPEFAHFLHISEHF